MMKYKVGDKVKIRKDLEVDKSYGLYYVTQKMHDLGGKIARITEVYERRKAYRIDLHRLYWTDEMFEDVDKDGQKMNKRVVIDTHENYVVARCGDKEGYARCHPDDNFDFYVGAKLALERLEEAEKPYGWLKRGVRYYVPRVTYEDLYGVYVYYADDYDKRYAELGIAFRTKEEAIECAIKMLEVVKREG